MTYVDLLARELAGVGIAGRRRRRILAEVTDHLECDPGARLGEPRDLARQFADELGTTLARRAALRSFVALAVAGVLLVVCFLLERGPLFSPMRHTPVLEFAGSTMALLGAQVAFVAGIAAALRAIRRRQALVVPRGEAVMMLRRAAVGVGAGIVAMVGFALIAVAVRHVVAAWWFSLALTAAGASVLALLAVAPSVLAASRLRPVADGPSGDVFDDLGALVPGALRGRPWRFALAVAAGVALAIAVVGVAQADPFDGALRGIADGAACLAGFAVLGRYLGLRA